MPGVRSLRRAYHVDHGLQFYLFSDGGVEEQISTVTSDVYVEVVARVLSQITGVIRAGADDGCSIDVINSAQVRGLGQRLDLYRAAPRNDKPTGLDDPGLSIATTVNGKADDLDHLHQAWWTPCAGRGFPGSV